MHGLADKVDFESAAKTSAQWCDVHRDLVFFHPRYFGGHGACHLRHLRGQPDLHMAVFDLRGAVHGLHRGVGQIGRLVQRVDAACCAFFGLADGALFVKSEAAFGVQAAEQRGLDAARVRRTRAGRLPLHLQGLSGLARLPGVVGHHGQASGATAPGVEGHDFFNAGQGQCGGGVGGLDRATQLRAHAHGSKQHARQAHIGAKLGLARDFGGDVGARCGLANQSPLRTWFGLDARGCAGRRGGHHLAVMRRLSGGVLQHARSDGDLAGRHLPCSSSGLHQAGPRGGSGHAQGLPQVGHRRRAAGGVQAQLAGDFAHQPFAHLDLDGFVLAFAVQRVKGQAGHQHGHVAINAVGTGLL